MDNNKSKVEQEKKGGENSMDDTIKRVENIKDLTIDQIDEIAETVGKELRDKRIKTNQIRNIYGYISRIRNAFNNKTKSYSEIRNMIIFLKPKLAYIAGRMNQVKESKMDKLYRTAIDGLTKLDDNELEKALDNFFKLSEAIVAYHRYYAG